MRKSKKQPTTTAKEPTEEQLQGNQHDKIIKESLEETTDFILREFGGITVKKTENLPTEIQQTQERKPDFLKLVTDQNGIERIGHIEFHVKDEADITYRAFETCAMMKRKKPDKDIMQYIVYMGEKPAQNILSQLEGDNFSYKIKLVQIINIPLKVFLQGENPAEIVMGILADFGDKDPKTVISEIVEKVSQYAKTDLERQKFLQHLRIFGKLRNFEQLIKNIMESISAYLNLKDEDDFMYKKGEARAKATAQQRFEQAQRFSVIRMLDKLHLTDNQIIESLDITYEFVQNVKKDLAAAPKRIVRLRHTLSPEQIAEKLNLPIQWVEKKLLEV